MPRQPRKQKVKQRAKLANETESRHQSNDRLCNDWLEFLFLVCASIGVGGGIFALIYLAHVSGAI